MTKNEQLIEIKREARNTVNLYYALLAGGILIGGFFALGKNKSLFTKISYVLIGGAVVGVPATLVTRNKLSNLLAKAQKLAGEVNANDKPITETDNKIEAAERVIGITQVNNKL